MVSWVCSTEQLLQIFSAIFAIIAAVLWFAASRNKRSERVAPDEMILFGGSTVAAFFKITRGIARQSRQNARAAFFAGCAALCQIPSGFQPTCWIGAPWFLPT
jgi:ABC-type Fe3+-siderophore transport system permease subunit